MIRNSDPFTGRTALCWLAAVSAIAGIFVASPHSVVSLLFYYLLFMIAHRIVLGRVNFSLTTGIFAFYVCATLLLYWAQLIAIPDYFGFSGGKGVGTDDNFFYSLAAPVLPEDFPLRTNYFSKTHPYGILLSVFADPMYALYGELHPLDLLLFNAAGLALMPFVVYRTAQRLTGDDSVARVALVLSMICPFTIANGTILIRDGLVSMLFITSFYALISRRYILLTVGLLCVAYLRLPHALMLVGTLWMIVMITWLGRQRQLGVWRPNSFTITVLVAAPLVLGTLAWLYLGTAMLDKLAAIEGPFREGFLNDFVLQQASQDEGTTTFYTINQLALPLRLPLAFLFYFGAPHLALDMLVIKGMLVPRQLLEATYAVLFVLYSGFFLRGVIRAWDTGNSLVLAIAVTYCIDLLILSQASMQIRHKLAIVPLMYIVVAYGLKYRQRDAVIAGTVLSLGVGTFEFLFNGYKLWTI